MCRDALVVEWILLSEVCAKHVRRYRGLANLSKVGVRDIEQGRYRRIRRSADQDACTFTYDEGR
jgi:hypothetical protein